MAATDTGLWIALGVGAATVVIAVQATILYLRQWSRSNSQKMELERERLRLERDRLEHEYSRRKRNDPDSLLYELLSRQNELLNRIEPPTVVVNVADAPRVAGAAQGGSVGPPGQPQADYTSLIREISHSLNTPLSAIESEARVLRESGLNSPDVGAIGDRTGRILKSIEICNAFLSGFRQLTQVADSAARWNPKSLTEAIVAAGEIYATSAAAGVTLAANIAEEVGGYPNSYVLSVLLPLLENAFEAATPDSRVQVEMSSTPEGYELEVINSTSSATLADDIDEPGVSTKENHQGLGLPVVKRLLSAYDGASLNRAIQGNRVQFKVFLPNRQGGRD